MIILTVAIAAFLLCCPLFLYALPKGEHVAAGSATFDRSESDALTVSTSSNKLIVNYDSFSIAQPEVVHFEQPSASATVLNRVVGVEPSSIMGTLTANGKVFLVNPNGVLFGPNARVDVAALVASTLDISDDDFLKGNFNFFKKGKNSYVINQGEITAQPGGYICLLSPAVANQGKIRADLGTVVLASGEKMTLSLDDLNTISVVIDEAVKEEVFGPEGKRIDSAVKNSGTISANGGKVILTAKVLNHVFDYAINNEGVIEAAALENHNGVIELVAEGAPVVNSGTLQAAEVYIKVKDDGFTNTKEAKVIADGSAIVADGGRVSIEAATVLQQGLISANALEGGTAGEVAITTQSTGVLDEGSTTEARAMGLIGNGGRVLINSQNGSVFVNKGAKIDVSAGTIAGNGGYVEVGAFEQVGFYGVLNGRAPPGFQPGIALLDPDYATISGEIYSYFTVDAWRDIVITGDIHIYQGYSLTLLADHKNSEQWDDEYDPGIGAIINDGDYTISGDYLFLAAGSGIGTASHPVKTAVNYLSAEINPDAPNGDIFIYQASGDLGVYEIYAPGRSVSLTSEAAISSEGEGEILARDLILWAGTGIGNYEVPLRTAVTNLLAINTTSGSININNSGDLTIMGIANAAGKGSIDIYSSGDMRVRYGIQGYGDITLTASHNIYLNTIANITAPEWARVSLTAQEGEISRRNLEVEEYGLQAYWNFEEGSGYIAYDVSGNGYNGYIYGNPVWVEGQFGKALYFDGKTTYVDTDRILGLGAEPFTIIVWYQGTQVAQYVGLVGATPGTLHGFTMENHYGYVQNWVNDDKDLSQKFISDGLWHQLVMERNGSLGSMYIDGAGDTLNFATSPDSVDTSSHFWIGGWGNMRRLTQGAIDEVRVYTRALSELEIASQYMFAPGQGQVVAGSVSLSAANGIDIELNGVQNLDAVNSGEGDINIINHGELTINRLEEASGNVFIQAMSSLIINTTIQVTDSSTLYLSADGDITLNRGDGDYPNAICAYHQGTDVFSASIIIQAGGNIYLGGPVYSSAEYTGEGGSGYVTSGGISLTAGGSITLDGADVYSSARVAGEGVSEATAQSGGVSLTAGRDITLDNVLLYSEAYPDGMSEATGTTGDISISALGGNIAITDSKIFSQVGATNSYGGESSAATATSGDVSINAYGTIQVSGNPIYSAAEAEGSDTCSATSGEVTFNAGGDITIGSDVYSSATADGFVAAYATSDKVNLVTLGSILLSDGMSVYSKASAQAIGGFTTFAQAFSGDITFGAGADLTVSGEVEVYSDAAAFGPDTTIASSGNLDMSADGSVLFDTAALYSRAETIEQEGTINDLTLTAGDVSVHAGEDLTLQYASLFSEVSATACNAVSATSGDIILESVGGSIILADYSNIYSEADAQIEWSGELSSATATSGNIKMTAYDAIGLNGNQVYSLAEAFGEVEGGAALATATSGEVSLSAGGAITQDSSDVYSEAEATWAREATAVSKEVSFAAGSISVSNMDSVFSHAYADDALSANATSGDIIFEAAGGIDVYSESVYSSAEAYATLNGYATTGIISLIADWGDIVLSGGSDVYAKAVAQVGEAIAQATAGAVTLDTAGNIVINGESGVYSSATANSPSTAEALSGDITMSAGGDITADAGQGAEFPVSIDSDAQSTGSSASTANSGKITLTAPGDILLTFAEVYSSADASGSTYGKATVTSISKDVVLISDGGSVELIDTSAYSQAIADDAYTASATSGKVNVFAATDMTLAESGQIYSYAEADGTGEALSASASSKEVWVLAGGNILIDFGSDIYSNALAEYTQTNTGISGDVDVEAAGNLELHCGIKANVITLFADTDWDGNGQLIIYGGDYMPVDLVANQHHFAGANDFDLYEEYGDAGPVLYFDGYDGDYSARLIASENGDLTGLEVISTLEDTMVVDSDLSRIEYIELFSAGNLEVYGDLSAATIHLWADADFDGHGDLISDGTVELAGINHTLKAAGDFVVDGNTIWYGDELFSANLIAPEGQDLGELTIESTAGDIIVDEGGLSRLTEAPINLSAGNDIYLNGPISAQTGGINLISCNGSLFAASGLEGPHLISASDIVLSAGNVIASLDAPCRVLVTEDGILGVAIYGQVDGVSGVFTGSTPSGELTLINTPPGIVYFNNLPIRETYHEEELLPPPPPPSAPPEEVLGYSLAQYALSTTPGTTLDIGGYQINTLTGPVFFYHPLTESDMAAFEELVIDPGSYHLSNGVLQISGHEGLLQFFEALDKQDKNK